MDKFDLVCMEKSREQGNFDLARSRGLAEAPRVPGTRRVAKREATSVIDL